MRRRSKDKEERNEPQTKPSWIHDHKCGHACMRARCLRKIFCGLGSSKRSAKRSAQLRLFLISRVTLPLAEKGSLPAGRRIMLSADRRVLWFDSPQRSRGPLLYRYCTCTRTRTVGVPYRYIPCCSKEKRRITVSSKKKHRRTGEERQPPVSQSPTSCVTRTETRLPFSLPSKNCDDWNDDAVGFWNNAIKRKTSYHHKESFQFFSQHNSLWDTIFVSILTTLLLIKEIGKVEL